MGTENTASPRARMVLSAARMICERGVSGVGMRQIAADAHGPRGSLQRYFPGGKNQILIEAIDLALTGVLDATRAAAGAEDLPTAIAMIVAPWRNMLLDYNFTVGCPIAAFVVDASSVPQLREHAEERFALWRTEIEAALLTFGYENDVAGEEALLLMSALEGATLVARATRSIDPVDAVERRFSLPPDTARGDRE